MKRIYDIFLDSEGICTDSRKIIPGSIFFALHGKNFDGNRFASDALEKGAAYAVVDDPRIASDSRYIVVENTLLAFQNLAAYHRKQIGIRILAITGTNGKTTTKELLFRVLGKRFRIASTPGNMNNHIGVPLTLLSMKEGDFGIVEMGASGEGEIKALCDIASPDYGIITNIGRAHLEGFGGEDGVKRTKGELYDYLADNGGTAFVNSDDLMLAEMAGSRRGLKVITYSNSIAQGFKTHLFGNYNAANIAAAVAVGKDLGVGADEIREAIASYVPTNNRSQRMETGHNTLIVDCYNANPSSMRAAIMDFASQDTETQKVLILGDMLELGRYAAQEHTDIIRLLEELDLNDIYLVGSNFTAAAGNYPSTPAGMQLKTFEDTGSLMGYLATNSLPGHFILLKGSRPIGLEKLLDIL